MGDKDVSMPGVIGVGRPDQRSNGSVRPVSEGMQARNGAAQPAETSQVCLLCTLGSDNLNAHRPCIRLNDKARPIVGHPCTRQHHYSHLARPLTQFAAAAPVVWAQRAATSPRRR